MLCLSCPEPGSKRSSQSVAYELEDQYNTVAVTIVLHCQGGPCVQDCVRSSFVVVKVSEYPFYSSRPKTPFKFEHMSVAGLSGLLG